MQALIGAAAVIWQQNDYVLALHFGISLISFSSVFLITLIIFSIDQNMKLTNYISKAIKTFNMVNGNHHLLWCLHWCTSATCGCKFSIWWLAIAIPRSCTTFRTRLGPTHASYHGFIVFTIIMITYIHAVKIIQITVLFIMVIQLHLYLLYYKLSQVHCLL